MNFRKIYNDSLKKREINSLDDAFEGFIEECIILQNIRNNFSEIVHLIESKTIDELIEDLQNQTIGIRNARESLRAQWNSGNRNWTSEERKQSNIERLLINDSYEKIKELEQIDKEYKKERNLTLDWLKDRNLISLEEYNRLKI
jgi:hypothetical protein